MVMTASRIAYCSIRPDGSAGTGGGLDGPLVCDDNGRLLDERGAGLEVDRLVRAEAQATGGTYGESLATVAGDPGHEPLVRLYTGGAQAAQQRDARAEAGKAIDRLARKRAVVRGQTYIAALADVLADPAYAEMVHRYATGAAKLPTGIRLNPGQVYDAISAEAGELMDRDMELDFADAFDRVLATNRTIRDAWVRAGLSEAALPPLEG